MRDPGDTGVGARTSGDDDLGAAGGQQLGDVTADGTGPDDEMTIGREDSSRFARAPLSSRGSQH